MRANPTKRKSKSESFDGISKMLSIVACIMATGLLFVLGTPSEVIVSVLVFILFSIPALPLMIAVFHTEEEQQAGQWALILASSLGLGCLSALCFIYFFGWNLVGLVFSQIGIGIVSSMFLQKKRGVRIGANLSGFDGGNAIEPVFVIITLMCIAIPLYLVGSKTDRGLAYPSLFGLDYLMRVAHSANVSHGLPIENPFFSGHPFPYYLVYYVFPASIYKFLGPDAQLHNIIRINDVILTILFVLCLFEFFRKLGFTDRIRWMLGALALLAYSYNGIGIISAHILRSWQNEFSTVIIEKGYLNFSSISHGWYRDFLIEPQAVLNLCIAVGIFGLALRLEFRRYRLLTFAAIGLLLATMFGIDSFMGAVMVLWFFGVMTLTGMRKRQSLQRMFVSLGATAVPALAVLGLYFLMGVFDPSTSGGTIHFDPSWYLIIVFPVFLAFEFGPMVILAFAGAWSGLRRGANFESLSLSLCLIGICLVFMFFFTHSSLDQVIVLRKSAKLMPIGLLALSGRFLSEFAEKKLNGKMAVLFGAIGLLGLLALPSLYFDIRTFSAVEDPELSSYIDPADYEACRWMIQNTPEDSVGQSWPASQPSLIAQVAERKMVLGDYIIANASRTDEDTPAIRGKDLQLMFRTPDSREAWKIAKKYNIEYIFWGTFEQSLAKEGMRKFENDSALFAKVYDRKSVKIFQVIGNHASREQG